MSDRAKYWQRLVAAWEKSGLSQAEFCRRRGIKAVNFAWWKRKLSGATGQGPRRQLNGKTGQGSSRQRSRRSPAGEAGEHAQFVEVVLPNPGRAARPARPTTCATASVGAVGYEVVLPGGSLIRLPGDFDPDRVSQLIRAVTSAC